MKLSDIAFGVLGVGVFALLGLSLYDRFSTRPAGTESVVAAPSPVLRNAPTARVAVKAPVTVYKGKTKARLKLPADVQADQNKHVVAASKVQPDLRPQTVTTVIDTETGAVSSYVKADPYPWFAIETRGEVRLAYGYKYNAFYGDVTRVARLGIGYDVLRVKALTAGVVATVDSDGDAFAGVAISYRW